MSLTFCFLAPSRFLCSGLTTKAWFSRLIKSLSWCLNMSATWSVLALIRGALNWSFLRLVTLINLCAAPSGTSLPGADLVLYFFFLFLLHFKKKKKKTFWVLIILTVLDVLKQNKLTILFATLRKCHNTNNCSGGTKPFSGDNATSPSLSTGVSRSWSWSGCC